MASDNVRRVTLLLAATAIASLAFASDEAVDTPEHVTGEQRYPFDSADPREEDEPPIELPDSVAPKLELLTPEEVEFLKSSDARAFAGSDEDTVEALNERTPEEVKAWVNANAVLNACLVGIAVRKSGLDPDYVHPLALDHGQR